MQLVVFDLDNTLYSYAPCNLAGEKAVLDYLKEQVALANDNFINVLDLAKKYVKERNKDKASSHNRILYFQNVCERLQIPVVNNALRMYDAYWNAYFQKMDLFPGAMDLLVKLKSKKIKIGICSDLTTNVQLRKLQKLGLDDVVDAIVTSEECGCEKPSSLMFEMILNKLNVCPKDSIMVGDSFEKDIQGAQKSGVRAILFGSMRAGILSASSFDELDLLLDSL